MATQYRITSPDPVFSGIVTGHEVVFSKGVALLTVDHKADHVDGATNLAPDLAALVYFKRRGYIVEKVTAPKAAADDASVAPDGPKVPAKTATKADWVAYAVTQKPEDGGLDEASATALTRDQLAEKYTEVAK